MTDEELAEIRQRAEAATPGPWKPLGGGSVVRDDDYDSEVVDWVSHNDADVAFVAHARADIPRLLDEIERLREELRQAKA